MVKPHRAKAYKKIQCFGKYPRRFSISKCAQRCNRFLKNKWHSLPPNKLLCFNDCYLHQRVAAAAAAARRDPSAMTTSPETLRAIVLMQAPLNDGD